MCVDVAADVGKTGTYATFDNEDAAPDAWQRWFCMLDLSPGDHRLAVRTVDDAGQSQPERPGNVWNFAGYFSTAWHRIAVTST